MDNTSQVPPKRGDFLLKTLLGIALSIPFLFAWFFILAISNAFIPIEDLSFEAQIRFFITALLLHEVFVAVPVVLGVLITKGNIWAVLGSHFLGFMMLTWMVIAPS